MSEPPIEANTVEMPLACPRMSPNLIITDDPWLAAAASCRLAELGSYLPIVEGPRMGLSDGHAEIARRNNTASRAKAEQIYLLGLSDSTVDAIVAGFAPFNRSKIKRSLASDRDGSARMAGEVAPLVWGRDRIGIGVLKALRARSGIIFADRPSSTESVASKSAHLVVCEEGDALSQVIAANYAFALRAGLHLIPAVDRNVTDEILEAFYSVYDQNEVSATQALSMLEARLRNLCGPLPLPANGSVTFITGGLPFGFGVQEAPSTHLFRYPTLGSAIINGFAAEQAGTPGIQFAALVDPDTTDSKEIDSAERILGPRGAFLRTYYGPGANVTDVNRMMEWLPYDLLLIATHCGDIRGSRWTYEFTDSEGHERDLVVDVAVGVGKTAEPNMLAVTQFLRFVSLDGVDWNDAEAKKALYVGTAIVDFMDRTREPKLEPVKKDPVERVYGSAALAMHDGNLILLPLPLADEGAPIVINNACVSWHRLAQNFTFGNARAYVGTLFPVSPFEAHDVVVKLLAKHFAKPLPAALWAAQRDVYGDSHRRPYVATGVYTQWLRVRRQDVVGNLIRRLGQALRSWQRVLAAGISEPSRRERVEETVAYYKQELDHFVEFSAKHPFPAGAAPRGRRRQTSR